MLDAVGQASQDDTRTANQEDAAVLEVFNLSTVGLVLDIVGIIFLANSMGIRNPRRFLNEHFGIERRQPLRAVYQQLRVKAQIFTGFLFLLIGFGLGILGAVLGEGPAGVSEGSGGQQLRALLLVVLVVLGLTLLLRLAQNAWSLSVFRRLLCEFFQDHADWAFEKHPQDTQEIGEILGVPRQAEDSIGDYADRIRTALGLVGDRRRLSARGQGDDAFAPLRGLGADRRH